MASNGSLGENKRGPSFETDAVVVGTGPAGGAIASFLGSYGKR